MYAQVIIDITHEKLDRVFTYCIPSELEGMLQIGMEVLVPFGASNKERHAYVVGFSDTCDFDTARIKTIQKILEDRVGAEAKLVALAAWMKEHYGGTMIQALKTVIPVKKKEKPKQKKYVRRLVSEAAGRERLAFFEKKSQKARARLMEALLEDEEISYDLVTKKLNVSPNAVKTLEEQGILRVVTEHIYRNPLKQQREETKEFVHTQAQREAIERFAKDYARGIHKTYLLHGVTGSGKTEVYMEMIAKVLKRGEQAIVLIPEIALTYQTVMRFYRRFGDRVSIMHSRLSSGERYDQMERAKCGDIDIMIGPRSALFTPFANVGLIVIDEEHEQTYKSEQVPRFHARETAIQRARMEGASVVLGSATPSMEAYYRCENGEYELLKLQERVKARELPSVYTIDMRQELKEGNKSAFSAKLHELMEERLAKREQIMLFLNRRGYSGFVSCRSCGYVPKCPHCDVALSMHRGGKMVCHYCGYEAEAVIACPSCGSRHISGFRAGTQQIEALVQKEFPEAKVLRMDMDTTGGKDGHEKILSAFAGEEADILIGTQMIVKGHDFANVTLVGILAADLSLYTDDFRSGERTFQLLTQAAGRAGRGKKKGEVVIQTYNPEHYSILHAAKQDYESFYAEEMQYRSLMGYPPAEHLMAVLMSGEVEVHLEKAAHYLKEYAFRIARSSEAGIVGPASPYVGKVNDIFRRILYIRHARYDILIEIKDRLEEYIEMNKGYQSIRIQFDFDPMGSF